MSTLDKRKSPRIIVDYVSVEIYTLASDIDRETEIRDICTVRNISETGMMFESDKQFGIGAILRLTFALPESPIVIRTDAIVIHASRKKSFDIGVQYKNLALAEQKLLHHFMNRALKKDETAAT
ncbi:MAG: PilZ domain-containing protein [Chitinispirillaceae bacterium]|nr:PilZ domain-containing protein [Chitinispirillaceae bacterium]